MVWCIYWPQSGPKIQNCQFKLKFSTKMQNAMASLTFSVLDQKYLLWENLVKKQICQFKLKFGTKTN